MNKYLPKGQSFMVLSSLWQNSGCRRVFTLNKDTYHSEISNKQLSSYLLEESFGEEAYEEKNGHGDYLDMVTQRPALPSRKRTFWQDGVYMV